MKPHSRKELSHTEDVNDLTEHQKSSTISADEETNPTSSDRAPASSEEHVAPPGETTSHDNAEEPKATSWVSSDKRAPKTISRRMFWWTVFLLALVILGEGALLLYYHERSSNRVSSINIGGASDTIKVPPFTGILEPWSKLNPSGKEAIAAYEQNMATAKQHLTTMNAWLASEEAISAQAAAVLAEAKTYPNGDGGKVAYDASQVTVNSALGSQFLAEVGQQGTLATTALQMASQDLSAIQTQAPAFFATRTTAIELTEQSVAATEKKAMAIHTKVHAAAASVAALSNLPLIP